MNDELASLRRMYERLVVQVAVLQRENAILRKGRPSFPGAYVVLARHSRMEYGFGRMRLGDEMWCELKNGESPLAADKRIRRALSIWLKRHKKDWRIKASRTLYPGYVHLQRTS